MYYSDFENNHIMKFADKWMRLEEIILSELTQTQYGMHSLRSEY